MRKNHPSHNHVRQFVGLVSVRVLHVHAQSSVNADRNTGLTAVTEEPAGTGKPAYKINMVSYKCMCPLLTQTRPLVALKHVADVTAAVIAALSVVASTVGAAEVGAGRALIDV